MPLSESEKPIFWGGFLTGTIVGIGLGWTFHRLRRTYLDKKRDFFAKQLKKTEDQIKKDNFVDTKSHTLTDGK